MIPIKTFDFKENIINQKIIRSKFVFLIMYIDDLFFQRKFWTYYVRLKKCDKFNLK